MAMAEMYTQLGSAIAGLMFAWAMFQQYFPRQLRDHIDRHVQKLVALVYPYVRITFNEYVGAEDLKRSDAYFAIQNYLSVHSSGHAKKLKAHVVDDRSSVLLSIDDYEEVSDEFEGIKVWWASSKNEPQRQTISWYGGDADEKRFYSLKFHRRHREIITKAYINHVLKEGKAVAVDNRRRKLYTNNPSQQWDGWRGTKWSHMVFEHPATFETLAMAAKKKEEIMKDLIKFSQGKEFYKRIGKAWKRGYLLYGQPGTGKSTMIAAIANLMNYDIYDLELTTVKNNTELKKLLIETKSKSVIVIEDIDCSLDLTGQRKKKKEKDEGHKDPISKKKEEEEKESKSESKVTLSGLLNFIDGIWSSCGGERIIVFTTNYADQLDPALIRRGRMDKHIEMSYCCFEAFKVLAKNYLEVDSHELFGKIARLLDETKMTPADVAECLMPKSDEDDAETCLKNLIVGLEEAKEEARKKAEEEAKERAEEEGREEKDKDVKDEAPKVGVKENEGLKENGTVVHQ